RPAGFHLFQKSSCKIKEKPQGKGNIQHQKQQVTVHGPAVKRQIVNPPHNRDTGRKSQKEKSSCQKKSNKARGRFSFLSAQPEQTSQKEDSRRQYISPVHDLYRQWKAGIHIQIHLINSCNQHDQDAKKKHRCSSSDFWTLCQFFLVFPFSVKHINDLQPADTADIKNTYQNKTDAEKKNGQSCNVRIKTPGKGKRFSIG